MKLPGTFTTAFSSLVSRILYIDDWRGIVPGDDRPGVEHGQRAVDVGNCIVPKPTPIASLGQWNMAIHAADALAPVPELVRDTLITESPFNNPFRNELRVAANVIALAESFCLAVGDLSFSAAGLTEITIRSRINNRV